MSKIRVLGNDLINKIAAGEVVERPASVVKELLENSIDASSTRIEVEIRGGGIDYIRVTDNGCGMEEDDLILSFTRHATSKLTHEDDLWTINTMGFRGEALPSIASVAEVDVSSNNGESGLQITVNGGEISPVKPAAAPPGTSIIVKDLFFNIPARRKFLKTNVTEGNQIYEVVSKIALSKPEVSISFSNENRQVFMTSGDGVLINTVRSIYGKDYADKMIPFDHQFGDINAHGLIGRTDFTRKNRKGQSFFVNNRVIRSPLLSAALEDAFRGLLISQERPIGIIFLSLAPDMVDVNVHPQKAEVRFRNEQQIFQVLKTAVRETLYKSQNKGFTDIPSSSSASWASMKPSSVNYRTENAVKPNIDWNELFNESNHIFEAEQPAPPSSNFKLMGQWQDSYLIFQTEETLEIMDQHAAHERILFNQLQISEKGVISQELAVAVLVELAPDLIEQFESKEKLIRELGYEAQIFGERSIIIRSVPTMVAGNEVETLLEILDSTGEVDEWGSSFDKGLKVMACKGAVKAGQKLSRDEMEELISEWLKTPEKYTCPHGRPVCISYDSLELARAFKR
ncbi:MAG: DNA mismatch repair endonuclease MutL [Ignavibacteriales bacterium]